jgi:hypothetical protein
VAKVSSREILGWKPGTAPRESRFPHLAGGVAARPSSGPPLHFTSVIRLRCRGVTLPSYVMCLELTIVSLSAP